MLIRHIGPCMRFELPLLKVGLKGFLEEVFLSYMTSIRYGSVKKRGLPTQEVLTDGKRREK